MLDKQTPSILKGINKDQTFKQPNTVTFALNAITNAHDGGKMEYQSEPGTEIVQGPLDKTIIGTIYGQDNEVYVFSTNSTSDEIGLFKSGYYQTLVEADFNFNVKYPITGEYRIRNGCDRVIYWCDHFNPDRWFNRDKENEFKTLGDWDINKFKFLPIVNVPNVNLLSVNDSGGSLPLGSYYFQIEVLDKNENSLYKTDISPQTIIYDESISNTYDQIDGGLNFPQYDTAIGGLSTTNKSITLTFTNLDTSFSYLKVNVARQIVGTQVIDAHVVADLIPISSNTINWTYRGYNVNAGDYPLDYSEMLTDNIRYDSSYVQEQVQGRLIRANLKQINRDYSSYQQFATQVTTNWVSKVVSTTDVKEIGNPKNPNTYWQGTSFQGDEVNALAIRYLHNDGTWSPYFHIPGREKINGQDDVLLTVVANNTSTLTDNQVWLSDVEHLPLTTEYFTTVNGSSYIGSTIEKWKVFNTFFFTEINTTDYPYLKKGQMGYHESISTYPDIVDCNNNLIWGNNITANVTKIRHHRFPDRTSSLEHLAGDNGEYIQLLGIEFNNVNYPATDIVAHQFGFGERDEFNKTVVDSGWIIKPAISADELTLNSYFTTVDQTHNYGRYNSAEIMFNKKLFNPDYIKLNKSYRIESELKGLSSYSSFTTTSGTNLKVGAYHLTKKGSINNIRRNYNVLKQVYIQPYSNITNNNFPVAIKNTANKLSADSAIQFSYALPNLQPILGNVSFGQVTGNPGIYKFNMMYCYKKVNSYPFDSLFTINYKYINFNPEINTVNIYFNGDTIIAESRVVREQILTGDSNNTFFDMLSYNHFYEEHQFNTALRHEGTTPLSKYYRNTGDPIHFIQKITDLSTTSQYILLPVDQWRTENYSYNKDFDKQSNQIAKLQLPFNYDYCSNCSGTYTNRIIFSPKSFDEENIDLYRFNKVNDYIDLPGHKGAIKGIKYQNNQLLVLCEDSSFILQPNPQQISTDQNTAYLTTGDFLSIPPQELIQTDTGFAGSQSKQHQCSTPFGYAWCDQKRGEMFLYNNQVESLSNKGLTQWFKENLPSQTNIETYKVFQKDYPNKSTMDPIGSGLVVYYDPRFKRVIVTKKDYKPIDYVERPNIPGLMTYSFEYDKWLSTEFIDGPTYEIEYGDPDFFEDKRWTLSYSLEEQSWTSWHSYFPTFAFSDDSFYYSSVFQVINRHMHKNNYQTYYGNKYEFIVDWMNFDVNTDRLQTIHYLGYTLQWDSLRETWNQIDDVTFDKLLAYNNNQSTGYQTLIYNDQHLNPYVNSSINAASKYVIKTDQNYKISGLYDMSVNKPVISSRWIDKKSYPPYIDFVPTNINYFKSQYEWSDLSDKFVNIRLFFKPTTDCKKVLILQLTNEQQSVR